MTHQNHLPYLLLRLLLPYLPYLLVSRLLCSNTTWGSTASSKEITPNSTPILDCKVMALIYVGCWGAWVHRVYGWIWSILLLLVDQFANLELHHVGWDVTVVWDGENTENLASCRLEISNGWCESSILKCTRNIWTKSWVSKGKLLWRSDGEVQVLIYLSRKGV